MYQGQFKIALVIANESLGHDYSYLNPDMVIIGNEPDVDGPSSWTMTQDEYVDLWQQHRALYTCPAVCAGAASGDPAWWDTVIPRLTACAGMNVHPYGKDPKEAADLINAYQAWFGMIAHIGEWHRPVDEIADFIRLMNHKDRLVSWFCWSDGMVDGFGLVRANGELKPEYKEFSVNVGQGIVDLMAAKGDQPAQDSWFMTNPDGTNSEMCVGRLGIYYATNVSGGWEIKFAPFE